MILAKCLYERIKKRPAPYYFNYSLLTILCKPVRKFFCQVLVPYCSFNCIRILIYRLCGFKIGKYVFIGMLASIISKTPACDGMVVEKNAVIGACTLVNKNVPEGMTAVGVLCKILGLK